MRTPKNPTPVSDDELRQEYEKTALYRMGIPMERAFDRLPWLRGMMGSGAARRSPQSPSTNNRSPTRSPRSNAAKNKRPPESP
ncbi:MAG: hypothetical protein Q8L39_10635 [Burkholderiales bacterium]|nr:hypothetical protein [Burkholderiales bacterium]